jgi:type II secretory pathway pseudopilin PulG
VADKTSQTVVSEGSENPYVGPRAFEADEREYFYGRDDEIAILTGLVMTRRASLFFAQSGAGKSSLLRAGLIPELTRQIEIGRGRRRRNYQKMYVLPILSVGGAIPSGMQAAIDNVYVFSALYSLYPDADPDGLAGLPLSEGLADSLSAEVEQSEEEEVAASDLDPDTPYLLVFDQFEEIFSHYQERWRDREAFFRQVTEALAAYPRLHVVFTMREDFIAELTPYANLIPEGLRPRFRLERLRRDAALSAVTAPAAKGGRTFAEGVAEELVDNLRRGQPGQTRQAGALAQEAELGAYVEPVHLQIVCRQLWEKLPAGQTVIEAADVHEFGDVDQALIGFYEGTLAKVGDQTAISERVVRSWFDEKLITPARTRGLVYRGDSETEGLPNEAIDILNNAYIIRASVRGGDIWYELAHDRLVEPVLEANQRWRENYHNPLDSATRAWLAAGRDQAKLLAGVQLEEAQAFADAHPAELLPEEQEFLAESGRQAEFQAEQARLAARRRRRTIIAGIAVIIVLAIAAVVAAGQAVRASAQERQAVAAQREAEEAQQEAELQKNEAELQREEAVKALKKAARSEALRLSFIARRELNDGKNEIALLLVIEAKNVLQLENVAETASTDRLLLQIVQAIDKTRRQIPGNPCDLVTNNLAQSQWQAYFTTPFRVICEGKPVRELGPATDPFELLEFCYNGSADACTQVVELSAEASDPYLDLDICLASTFDTSLADIVMPACQRAGEEAAALGDVILLYDVCFGDGTDRSGAIPECGRLTEIPQETDDPAILTGYCSLANVEGEMGAVFQDACSRAVELAEDVGDPYLQLDICRSVSGNESLNEAVLLSCERAVELAAEEDDPFLNLEICREGSLNANLAEISLPLCRRTAEQAIEMNDVLLLFDVCQGDGIDRSDVISDCSMLTELIEDEGDPFILAQYCSMGDVGGEFTVIFRDACQRAVRSAEDVDDPFLQLQICEGAEYSASLINDVLPACERAVELAAEEEYSGLSIEVCRQSAFFTNMADTLFPACQRAAEEAAAQGDVFLLFDACFAEGIDRSGSIPECRRLTEIAQEEDDPYVLASYCSLGDVRGESAAIFREACERAVALAEDTEDPQLYVGICREGTVSTELIEATLTACRLASDLAGEADDSSLDLEICQLGSDFRLAEAVAPACERLASDATPILFGSTVRDTVEESGAEVYSFRGEAGQAVVISLDEEDGEFDPLLVLLGPDNTFLVEDDDGGGNFNSLIRLTLPESGTYVILAQGFGGMGGAFELGLEG